MRRQSIQAELRPHIDNNELLLWTGRPKQGVIFRPSDLFLIPFSILWCGFAIFWVIMAYQAGGLFALFGVPFVFVGLIFVFGRFFIDAKNRNNTFYGITEDRILIKSGLFSKTVSSITIKTLTNIEYNEKNDLSGTITFGSKKPMSMMNGMNWMPGAKITPQLDSIPNVKKVYNQIIELQRLSN